MKRRLAALRLSTLSCLALLLAPTAVRAQEPRLPHADAAVSLGWLHADMAALSASRDDWASRRVTLGGQAGYYWTEHLKTEISAERSNVQDLWGSEQVFLPDGQLAFRYSEHHVQDTRVSIGQFYQFGHNAWTHTLVGGGISLTRRHVDSNVSPLQRHDRTGTETLEPGLARSSADSRVNAFAAAALKAYVTPRVFVRSELQADFRANLEAVVLRVGVGVDF